MPGEDWQKILLEGGLGLLEAERKTLAIEVHPDRRVLVRAPLGTDADDIQRRVRKRAAWIQRQQDFFRGFEPTAAPRYYLSGETHAYLGRRYRLKWQLTDRDEVKLEGGYLRVSMPGKASPERAKALIETWLRTRAVDVFAKRLQVCFPPFAKQGFEPPRMQVRWMRRRWGSLSPHGLLTLNAELIRAPRECIDYVITHELCHLQYPVHSPAFWRLLEQVMPEGQRRKQKLESWMAD